MSATTTRHTCPDGNRCAHVNVDGAPVTLSFHGDLSPVEAVAAFLRDVADYLCLPYRDPFLDLAEQLDPAAEVARDTAARTETSR